MRPFLLLAMSFFTFLTAAAQDVFPQRIDSLGDGFYRTYLPSGLEVWAWQREGIPLVTCDWITRYGSQDEFPAEHGYSNFFAHHFVSPNSDIFLPEMLQERIELNGMEVNCRNGRTFSSFRFSVSPARLSGALGTWSSLVRDQVFDAGESEARLQVIAAEEEESEGNPFFVLSREMDKRLFGDQAYRWNPAGRYAVIRKGATDEWKRVWNREVRPEHSLAAFAGWMDPMEIFRMADTLWGSWNAESVTAEQELPPLRVLPPEPPVFLLPHERQPSPVILISWASDKPGREEDFRSVFADAVMNHDGPFFRRWVESWLFEDIRADVAHLPSATRFSVIAFPKPGMAVQAAEWLWEEFRKDASAFISEEQPEVSFNDRMRQEDRMRQITSHYIHELGIRWALSRGGSGVFDLPENFPADRMMSDWENFIRNGKPLTAVMCNSSCIGEEKLQEWIDTLLAPEPVAVVQPEPVASVVTIESSTIRFRFNSEVPDSQSRSHLQKLAASMQALPAVKVYLDGHTDTRGPAPYNLELSRKRAESVRDILSRDFGISPDRMIIRAFGEMYPVAEEKTDEDLAKNRRVEIRAAE